MNGSAWCLQHDRRRAFPRHRVQSRPPHAVVSAIRLAISEHVAGCWRLATAWGVVSPATIQDRRESAAGPAGRRGSTETPGAQRLKRVVVPIPADSAVCHVPPKCGLFGKCAANGPRACVTLRAPTAAQVAAMRSVDLDEAARQPEARPVAGPRIPRRGSAALAARGASQRDEGDARGWRERLPPDPAA